MGNPGINVIRHVGHEHVSGGPRQLVVEVQRGTRGSCALHVFPQILRHVQCLIGFSNGRGLSCFGPRLRCASANECTQQPEPRSHSCCIVHHPPRWSDPHLPGRLRRPRTGSAPATGWPRRISPARATPTDGETVGMPQTLEPAQAQSKIPPEPSETPTAPHLPPLRNSQHH